MFEVAVRFGITTQTKEGDGKKEWYQKRRQLDHAGLELTLRDEVPERWARNQVRDLVVLLAATANGEHVEVHPRKGLDTPKRIEQAWRRLGVRAWA